MFARSHRHGHSGGRYGVGSSALTHGKTVVPLSQKRVLVPESFSVPTLAPTRLSSLRASLLRRHSSTAAPAPLLRIAQCRHRRPAPPHHAAAAPRCATCCRKRAPHHAHFTRCSLLLVPSQCRCNPCSALLAAAFFARGGPHGDGYTITPYLQSVKLGPSMRPQLASPVSIAQGW